MLLHRKGWLVMVRLLLMLQAGQIRVRRTRMHGSPTRYTTTGEESVMTAAAVVVTVGGTRQTARAAGGGCGRARGEAELGKIETAHATACHHAG